MIIFIVICVFVTIVKCLFVHLYHSTDFEVHRNWLAITHSLPIQQWYTDTTSQWTLDYPPAFAYFEWALSQLARFVDPAMLDVHNLDYASEATVLFQRMSVIGTDALLMFGTFRFMQAWKAQQLAVKPDQSVCTAEGVSLLAGIIVGNFGLLLVDHIHFQYNGMLFGVLLLSIASVWQQQYVRATVLFTTLLCMKHIFLYMAPVFGVYLLRYYVLQQGCSRRESFGRFVRLAATVVIVVAAVFAPFVGQLPEIAGRLFPFGRGLSHAYWAPNWWALYNGADKLLASALKRRGRDGGIDSASGLIGTVEHVVLPSVRPAVTLALTLSAMAPCLWRMARLPWNRIETPRHFVRALVLCAGAAFLFGWHVHEKAILMLVIPLGLLCLVDAREALHFELLSLVAHYSLFPLLDVGDTANAMKPLKFVMWLLYGGFVSIMLRRVHTRADETHPRPWYETVYMAGFKALFVFDVMFGRVLIWSRRWPFLPLMLCSLYCAIGVLYFWLRYYWHFMVMTTTTVTSTAAKSKQSHPNVKYSKQIDERKIGRKKMK